MSVSKRTLVGYSFGFGSDVPLQNLKVDHINNKFFKKRCPIHIPVGPILCQILSKITGFFSIWILDSFENQPVHIQNFAFYKGSFIYQEADFATDVGGTSP